MPPSLVFGSTPLEGLFSIERHPVTDRRGFFERLICIEEFRTIGLDKPIVQVNRSLTIKKGTVRGLHFQYPPYAETKIVFCAKGVIFDVAVDIRYGSSTFLQWHGEVLSEKNRRGLYVPEGFAHGFQTIESDCQVLYFVTAAYNAQAEGALNAEDPQVGVSWPIPIVELSERDRMHVLIDASFKGLRL